MPQQEDDNAVLAMRIQRDGDQDGSLRLQLLRMNEGFCYSVYKRYAPFVEYEDLQSIAYLAIDKAVQTYNPDRGTFLTALAWALNTEMQKAVSDNQLIRLPDASKADLRRLRATVRDFAERHDRMPTEDEIERLTGITADQQRELLKMGQALYPESLNAETESVDGDTFTLGDAVPSDTDIETDTVEACYWDQLTEFLTDCIKALPKENRIVLNLHFMNGESLTSIAEKQNMHVNEVRKLKDTALKKLRQNSRLREYFEFENEYTHTGLKQFQNSFLSQPEFHIIKLERNKTKHED